MTDLGHQDGISIGREKVRLIRRREGLQVLVKSPKRRRRGSSSREVSSAISGPCVEL